MRYIKTFESFDEVASVNENYVVAKNVPGAAEEDFNDISISFSNSSKKGRNVESVAIPPSANWMVFHSMGGDNGSNAYNEFPGDFKFQFYSAGSPEEALEMAKKDYLEETGREEDDFEDEMIEIWDLKKKEVVNLKTKSSLEQMHQEKLKILEETTEKKFKNWVKTQKISSLSKDEKLRAFKKLAESLTQDERNTDAFKDLCSEVFAKCDVPWGDGMGRQWIWRRLQFNELSPATQERLK